MLDLIKEGTHLYNLRNPPVWIFHNRKYINNKINSSHELMLGIVYKDCKMSFAEHPLNLRNSLIYASYKIKTVRKTTETITYLGPKIWSIVQDEIKESASLETFRQKTHLWKTNN